MGQVRRGARARGTVKGQGNRRRDTIDHEKKAETRGGEMETRDKSGGGKAREQLCLIVFKLCETTSKKDVTVVATEVFTMANLVYKLFSA